MGPSQEFAHQQANKALLEIGDIFRKYHVMTSFNYDVGIDTFREEQAKNFQKLDELIKELFWIDACDSF